MIIHFPYDFKSEQQHNIEHGCCYVLCFLGDSLQILCIVDNMLMMVTSLLFAGLLLCIIGVPGLCLLYFKEFEQKWQMGRSWFVIWHEFQHLVTSNTLQSIEIPPSPYQSASGAIDGYDNRDDHSPLNSIGFLMNPRVTFLSSLSLNVVLCAFSGLHAHTHCSFNLLSSDWRQLRMLQFP